MTDSPTISLLSALINSLMFYNYIKIYLYKSALYASISLFCNIELWNEYIIVDSAGRSSGHRKGEHPTGCRLAVAMRDL